MIAAYQFSNYIANQPLNSNSTKCFQKQQIIQWAIAEQWKQRPVTISSELHGTCISMIWSIRALRQRQFQAVFLRYFVNWMLDAAASALHFEPLLCRKAIKRFIVCLLFGWQLFCVEPFWRVSGEASGLYVER